MSECGKLDIISGRKAVCLCSFHNAVESVQRAKKIQHAAGRCGRASNLRRLPRAAALCV